MNSASADIWPKILIVDDNAFDVKVVKRALKSAGYPLEPKVVDDGEPALALLKHEPPYENEPTPDLVILDLNLVTVDGAEVLRVMRTIPALSRVVVAILSSSPEDIMRSRAAQADCYFYKSIDLQANMALGPKIINCFRQRASCG
jgi:CheY-like chemotaxis protein